MRVLITGSRGFVGKHVVKELEGDHELLTPSRQELDLINIQDYRPPIDDLLNYIESNEPDAIVHLAATCGGIGINKDNPGRFIYENLQMGINVLEAARLTNVKKVVNLGTVCSYPKHAPIPFQEKDLWNGYPEETNAPYGIAKKSIMEMGIAYHRQYGLDVTNLIPVNMAGEWDNFDEYSSHVIPALIKKFESPQKAYRQVPCRCPCHMNTTIMHYVPCCNDGLVREYTTRAVELWGTGAASREFLYAGDCARAIAIALEKSTGPEPINLGTGQEITIRELAELVQDVGGYDAEIVWDDTKPDGQPRRCLDITRAQKVLWWEPRVGLRELLQRTIIWYRAYGSDSSQ